MTDKGSKIWTAGIIVVSFAIAISIAITCAQFIIKKDFYMNPSSFIQGVYSVDDGEWRTIDPDSPIDEPFHKIVFKGTLINSALNDYEELGVSTKNVWFTLTSNDGKVYLKHTYIPTDLAYANDEAKLAMTEKTMPFAISMPNTPGYETQAMSMYSAKEAGVNDNTEFTLEIVNPYIQLERYSDCFDITLSHGNGEYLKFFFESFPIFILALLVCFFGIFLFPIASFILGKLNYRYIAFGVLCVFWGVFMIVKNTGGLLNLWISDPTLCMAVDVMSSSLFFIPVMCYLKANMEGKRTRLIANIVITIYTLRVVLALILHFTNVTDMHFSFSAVNVSIFVGNVIMMILLFADSKRNRQAIVTLIAWTPLTISLILDVFNYIFHFADISFYYFGLALTMLYQIVQVIIDLRKQYIEAIRYEEMKRELYEAKVGIMVSQIQPHFIYNALTSIAMLCQLNPETAQEATITFADYLRGNMDSLKQTKPVLFDTELEHLKKYLYIEKIRFADLLNIEYDIQTTDFYLPLLSIQPLVENAIKHGVGMKEDGGTVTIATKENDNSYEVIITDDGVGFDTNAPREDDGRSHVGMENTKKRLSDMCKAKVEITSVVGEGTKAIVILPKEGQPDENTMR